MTASWLALPMLNTVADHIKNYCEIETEYPDIVPSAPLLVYINGYITTYAQMINNPDLSLLKAQLPNPQSSHCVDA